MARKPTRFWHPARRAAIRVREAFESYRVFTAPAALDDVRPRIQHYLQAMYGESLTVDSLAPPKPPGFTTRALRRMSLVRERGASESSAGSIGLPSTLPPDSSATSALERYRVLAVQHAERIRRGSALGEAQVYSDLQRDLYQLAEAASVDAQIAEHQPGLKAAILAARRASLAERPKPRWRTKIELIVEEMVRRSWNGASIGGNASADVPTVPTGRDAPSNAEWARITANDLESKHGRKAALGYRRVPEMTMWGTTISTRAPDAELALETETRTSDAESGSPKQSATRPAPPGPSKSSSSPGNRGNSPGETQNDNATSPAREPQRANGRDRAESESVDAVPDVNAQANGAGDNAAGNAGADNSLEAGDSDIPGVRHSENSVDDSQLADGLTYHYPEWDTYKQGFRDPGTTVRVTAAPLAPSEWGVNAVQQHAREVYQARRLFERLRSHRTRLRRQVQGDELDLEACVEGLVEQRMGVTPSDRVYSQVRPGRRELAITLLIDVSGSTGEDVDAEHRVIDVERIAALVATSAFDALGDDYSVLAFSSAGATNVRVNVLKDFGERSSSLVLQRIGALEPRGTTRLGAAIRHATAQLTAHPAPHRLLLIISDGKPHDYDWYFVDYAIQDSRHAVVNARLNGIHPFCITVDAAEGADYLDEIFGASGYRVVTQPRQLAAALLAAVQRMIRT